MAKEINEKTFELNITNELLNLSKSFIWYLNHFHWFPFPVIRNKELLVQFFQQASIFAEGLTQEEESNPLTGGYDVSINYRYPSGAEGRLMFLQYKSGIRKSYSNIAISKFYRRTARNENRSPEHIAFTFNDAAEGTQHSTLRNLSNSAGVSPNSVLYVFPRITEKTDFYNKVGNLIYHSSFVPVLEIDNQASNQTPQIVINDGITHKFRTSYDGLTSEVNYFYYYYYYDNSIIHNLLAELICIQIERFTKILIKQERPLLDIFLDAINEGINRFAEYELKEYQIRNIVRENVTSYIKTLKENAGSNRIIADAPSKYTTKVPNGGLKLRFDDKNVFSKLKYQIF